MYMYINVHLLTFEYTCINACRYELLRTGDKNKKVLDVIPPPLGGYTVPIVRTVAGQAKIYIRPIQQNLSLEQSSTDYNETVSI